MKREFLSIIMLLVLGCMACDDGKIYDENTIGTVEGSTLKVTARISGIDKWPDGYSVVVAGFGATDYAVISKGIPASEKENETVSIVVSGITGEVSQIELCVINRLRKRIATFYKTDFKAQADTIILNVGTINAGMFNCIQENVFNAYCTACHGTSNTAAAGLHLTSGDSYRALVSIPAIKSPASEWLVNPGNTQNSFLHSVLNTDITADWRIDHIDMITSPELLNLIDNWIEDGAKE